MDEGDEAYELLGRPVPLGVRLRKSAIRCWSRSFSIFNSRNVFNLGQHKHIIIIHIK